MLPAAHTPEEKQLKVTFENIKNARKAFEAALKKAGYSIGAAGKLELRANKKSVEDASENTEELKKKVIQGKISVKKADDKQTFKRYRVERKV
jgi:hypothetical protein